jgi:hypothetical protein
MKPLLITVALFGGCCIAGVLAARAESCSSARTCPRSGAEN